MISVIIPVYNAEKYLRRCLDSLLAQTYTDWLALCVDDGSSDGSGAVLDSYAASDSRFRVYHVPNGGASKARNIAMRHLEGEFLMLMDSDDFIHPQTMELCMKRAVDDSSDLITFTYNHTYRTRASVRQLLHLKDPKVHYTHYDPNDLEYRVSDDVWQYASEYSKPDDIDRKWAIKHCHPWRCLYRISRIDDLRFVEGIIYEDFPWWSMVLVRTKKVSIMRLPLYYYYPNVKGYILSSSNSFKVKSLECALAAADKAVRSEAGKYQLERWLKHFYTPVRAKLERKKRKITDSDL